MRDFYQNTKLGNNFAAIDLNVINNVSGAKWFNHIVKYVNENIFRLKGFVTYT
jgi:hypothetical protein